jgi:hypothetical protein
MTKRVSACAPTEQWLTTWTAFPEHSLVKILATQGCQLSQEGCFVIDRTSKYFKMVPETHMHILAHAMVLWNEFVRLDRSPTDTADEHDADHHDNADEHDADEHDVVGLVLLAIACFQIAVKQCGGHNCIRVHSQFCVTIAHNIIGRVYDTQATLHKDTREDLRSGQRQLLEAECRVLHVLQWNTLLLRRMEKATLLMEKARRLARAQESGKPPSPRYCVTRIVPSLLALLALPCSSRSRHKRGTVGPTASCMRLRR